MKVTVTQQDLTSLFQRALDNYTKQFSMGIDEDSQQFIARCYLEASTALLKNKNIEIEIEYKSRNYTGSIDDQ